MDLRSTSYRQPQALAQHSRKAACEGSRSPAAPPRLPLKPPGSGDKICQLTGDIEWEVGRPGPLRHGRV